MIENFIYHKGDAIKDVSAVDPFVIEGGGGGDGKGIAFVSVPRNRESFVVILSVCFLQNWSKNCKYLYILTI